MKTVLGALVGLALLASQAGAFTLTQGDVTIHLRDSTTLYTDVNGTMTPRAPKQWSTVPTGYAADGLAVGDESRSVLHIDQFTYDNSPSITPAVGELTGLVYGLKLESWTTGSTPGSLDLFFSGGKVQLWLDPTPDDANADGTIDVLDTFNPAGDGVAPTHWTGADQFPNVNLGDDAVLWLDTEFVPVFPNSNLTVITHLNTITGSGSSEDGYLKVVGGSAANLFETGIFLLPSGLSADLSVAYTLREYPHAKYLGSYAEVGGWQIRSEDPVLASIIPEPASLTLLGLGIAGLIARKRSRK